ncbi:hypothetical protein CRG98_015667, partial [Punica granatum]
AHTIGTTACFFVKERLYNFTSHGGSDPAINPRFLQTLKKTCAANGDVNVRLPLDPVTELKFDAQILRNIKNGFAVIASDARLHDDMNTKSAIDFYVRNNKSKNKSPFGPDFGSAMVKMGRTGVKTGSQGEIRHVCKSFN